MKMKQELISEEVDSWIAKEQRPVSPVLKPISKWDGLYPEDEDERQAYFDFLKWHFQQDRQLILSIPVPVKHRTRRTIETDESLSFPFSSRDYLSETGYEFDIKRFIYQKNLERVLHLATLHSCISSKDGKQRTFERYQAFVNSRYRDQALKLAEAYKRNPQFMDYERIVGRIKELNSGIRACKRIWNKYAYTE